MRSFMTMLALSASFTAMAQEKILLNNETALVNNSQAQLVRTASTPNVVKVYFNVPMTRLVCTRFIRVRHGRNSYSHCVSYAKITTYEADQLKLNFKNLPQLGGTEEDIFAVSARQRRLDSENVVYDISTVQSITPYEIIKKGILGYDSFTFKLK
jgi:hypothetical protein